MRWILLCIFLLFLPMTSRGEDLFSAGPSESSGKEPAASPEQAQKTPEPAGPADFQERMKKVVSISFTNADLRNVLNGLAKTYGLNIAADDKIKGTVNVTLKSVTLEEALRQILKLNGYTTVWEGSILKVASEVEPMATELIPLNFIAPDVALEFLKKEASSGAIMKVDEVQNGILVTEQVSKIAAMKQVLEKIDQPPQQVLIQARLLDVTYSDLENMGLKLSSASFQVPVRVGSPEGADRLLKVSSGSFDLSGPSSDLTSHTVTATFTHGSNTMTATLDALIRNKKVKVLASPTIGTLNNVQAKITIGEKFPIKETTQTTTGTLQTTRFVDIGTTLRVTPRISRSGFIQLQIHPEVSSVSSTLDAGPRITTREADTTVIVKDRESVIIAGLIKEEYTRVRDRIPILGYVPIFGLLFGNMSKTFEQKELVIVITPYLMPILPPHRSKGSEIDQLSNRIDANELLSQAEDSESGASLQSQKTPRRLRLLHAAELYERVGIQYPNFPFSPHSLWKAGDLQWRYFRNAQKAYEAFDRIVRTYPTHPYAERARRRCKAIRSYEYQVSYRQARLVSSKTRR